MISRCKRDRSQACYHWTKPYNHHTASGTAQSNLNLLHHVGKLQFFMVSVELTQFLLNQMPIAPFRQHHLGQVRSRALFEGCVASHIYARGVLCKYRPWCPEGHIFRWITMYIEAVFSIIIFSGKPPETSRTSRLWTEVSDNLIMDARNVAFKICIWSKGAVTPLARELTYVSARTTFDSPGDIREGAPIVLAVAVDTVQSVLFWLTQTRICQIPKDLWYCLETFQLLEQQEMKTGFFGGRPEQDVPCLGDSARIRSSQSRMYQATAAGWKSLSSC